MLKIATAVTALALAGGSFAGSPTVGSGGSVGLALRKAITAHFDTDLKDGASARWLWPDRHGGSVYCGWVNAKNGLGGYAGWIPYWVKIESNRVIEGQILSDDNRVNAVFGSVCLANGYDIVNPPPQR